jgi:hypothetical protein
MVMMGFSFLCVVLMRLKKVRLTGKKGARLHQNVSDR